MGLILKAPSTCQAHFWMGSYKSQMLYTKCDGV